MFPPAALLSLTPHRLDSLMTDLRPDPIPQDVWRTLLETSRVRQLDEGSPLWGPDQPRPDKSFIVVEGLMRLYHFDHKGETATVLAVGRGGLIGYHPDLSGSPYATGAEALVPSRLLILGATEIDTHFKEGGALSEDFAAWMKRDVDLHMQDTYARLLLEHTPAKERVARTLLALNEQNLLGRSKRRQLAELTNLSVETVVRTLSTLLEEGVLESVRLGRLSVRERRSLCGILTSYESSPIPYS